MALKVALSFPEISPSKQLLHSCLTDFEEFITSCVDFISAPTSPSKLSSTIFSFIRSISGFKEIPIKSVASNLIFPLHFGFDVRFVTPSCAEILTPIHPFNFPSNESLPLTFKTTFGVKPIFKPGIGAKLNFPSGILASTSIFMEILSPNE